MRTTELTRQTKETSVRLALNVDGTGRYQIDTGLGFFDHMLTQIAVHGFFDLIVKARGDLHIDAHHTIEDCAMVLGQAFHTALGDKAGIARMATCFVPMDDALSRTAIDLSGRAYSRVEVDWQGPTVGQLPTSLIEHFLESFAVACRCNLHAAVLYGRDNHHMAESLFKGLGRALDEATQIDPRRANVVPSSKGSFQ